MLLKHSARLLGGPGLSVRPWAYCRHASTNPSTTTTTSTSSTNVLNQDNVRGLKFSDLPTEFGASHQNMMVNQELTGRLKNIIRQMKAPVRYAFAYGSGVFTQTNSRAAGTADPQIDLIFGVTHTQHWHSLNMKYNKHHYSGLRYCGSHIVSLVQDGLGAGVYFNPFVTIDGLKIKYGVVNLDTLTRDLTTWDTLYLAGRLQKPVKVLRDTPQIQFANQLNLLSALRTALLLLPEHFTEMDLYMKIAGISYMGDLRMSFGENPHKVRNIVTAQFLNFRRLYAPLMDSIANLRLVDANHSIYKDDIHMALLEQKMDPTMRGNMVARLPSSFKLKLYNNCSSMSLPEKEAKDGQGQCKEGQCSDFDIRLAADPVLDQKVATTIRQTVGRPSLTQTIKGVLTAGIVRSVRYSLEKLEKYNLGRKTKVK